MNKKQSILLANLFIVSLYGMQDSLNESFGSLHINPKSNRFEWIKAAAQLAQDIKEFGVSSNDVAPGDDSDESGSSDETTDLHNERVFLSKIYADYTEMLEKREKINLGLLLKSFCDKVDRNQITKDKKVAVAWLFLVSSEDYNFFKEKMFEWGVNSQNKSTVKYLIKKELIDITKPNLASELPIHVACKNGDGNMVNLLIKHGAFKCDNSQNVIKRAIWLADCYGHDELAQSIKDKTKNKYCQLY